MRSTFFFPLCVWLLVIGHVIVEAQSDWLAGSATVILTPTVNGTTDYVKQIDEYDAMSPGTLVVEFDDGQIPIGNGDRDAHWVHDHVKASVFALRGTNNVTLVILGADIYMLFAPDIEIYFERVQRRVGRVAFEELRFLVAVTHNHHGPDTSGLSVALNRQWYSKMLDLFVDCTEAALNRMEPASLVTVAGDWRFGQGDNRDPRLTDPTLNILQAKSLSTGRIISTVVQWSFHPEITLGFNPTVLPEDCAAIGEDAGCSANGRYISGDFPSHLISYLSEATGGADVVYINGAVGCQIGPHGPVWEVSDQFPITGDGSVPPTGAVLVPKNFRKTLLVGRELANAVVNFLQTDQVVEVPVSEIDYQIGDAFTRINHIGFLAGLAPKYLRPNQPLVLGYSLRELFLCTLPPTNDSCIFDNYDTLELAGFPLPIRKGDFAYSRLMLVRFGPITIFTIPGELAPELAHGLPPDFDLPESVSKYYKNPQYHAVGSDYEMPGVLKDMLKCKFCWTFGLTGDASGYIFPISDWRVGCTGPYCDGDGYMTGKACKNIIDNNLEEGKYSCMLGQLSQVQDHYEEIISASWDIAGDVINAYSRLLGVPPSGRYTKSDWTQE